jgi:hypothetical protein
VGHDDLVLVDTERHRVRVRIDLPTSIAPPGLAALEGGKDLIVVLDDRVLVLGAASASVIHQASLDIAAVGWPAAVVGFGDRFYIAGQPRSSFVATARLEAFETWHNGTRLRALWRTNLGLTHAGIWLGVTEHHQLAGYLPDAHDLAGSLVTWSTLNGRLLATYDAPGPILAVDSDLNHFYGSVGGRVYTRALSRSGAIQERPGTQPVTVDSSRGLLLFARGKAVVVASARTLRPLGAIRLRHARSMAVADDGATLFVGLPTTLVRLDLASCGAP